MLSSRDQITEKAPLLSAHNMPGAQRCYTRRLGPLLVPCPSPQTGSPCACPTPNCCRLLPRPPGSFWRDSWSALWPGREEQTSMPGSRGPLHRAALARVALLVPLCPRSHTGQEGDWAWVALCLPFLSVRCPSLVMVCGCRPLGARKAGRPQACTAWLACLRPFTSLGLNSPKSDACRTFHWASEP